MKNAPTNAYIKCNRIILSPMELWEIEMFKKKLAYLKCTKMKETKEMMKKNEREIS